MEKPNQRKQWKQLMFVHSDLNMLRLSPFDFRILGFLSGHTTKDSRDAFPGLRKIAHTCCMNKDTVAKALERLEELKLIKKTGQHRGTATVYKIASHAEWRFACALISDTQSQEVSGSSQSGVRDEQFPSNSTEVSNEVIKVDGETKLPKHRATREHLVAFAQSRGRPKSDGIHIFEKLEARSWIIAGSQIKDAFAFFREYEAADRLPSQAKSSSDRATGEVDPKGWRDFLQSIDSSGYRGDYRHAPEYLRLDFIRRKQSIGARYGVG